MATRKTGRSAKQSTQELTNALYGGAKGQFKESDDVGRSLGKDVKQAAKRKVKAGHGDKGDRART
jgi:hypothetical protein